MKNNIKNIITTLSILSGLVMGAEHTTDLQRNTAEGADQAPVQTNRSGRNRVRRGRRGRGSNAMGAPQVSASSSQDGVTDAVAQIERDLLSTLVSEAAHEQTGPSILRFGLMRPYSTEMPRVDAMLNRFLNAIDPDRNTERHLWQRPEAAVDLFGNENWHLFWPLLPGEDGRRVSALSSHEARRASPPMQVINSFMGRGDSPARSILTLAGITQERRGRFLAQMAEDPETKTIAGLSDDDRSDAGSWSSFDAEEQSERGNDGGSAASSAGDYLDGINIEIADDTSSTGSN